MRFADLFCGIGGFRLALDRAGHEHALSCEIDPFPRGVYAHHFEDLAYGDVTQMQPGDFRGVDLVAGGFPCQDASSAGKGLGLLHGRRSGLVFRVVALAAEAGAKWLLLENVRGLLVRDRGFGQLLGVLSRLGYGWAYRTLDAQYFGVAQRRRRVFLVAGRGVAPERCGSILLEPQGLCGDPPTSGAERARVARPLAASAGGSGAEGSRDELVAGFNAWCSGGTESAFTPDGTPPLRGGCQVGVLAFDSKKDGQGSLLDLSPTLRAGGHKDSHPNAGVPPGVVIPFNRAQITHPANRSRCDPGSPAGSLAASGHPEHVAGGGWVRRLTPVECERLQGFPDGWTDVGGAADGPRYKALGNSVAVPCVEWIAHRLKEAERRGW